MENWQVVSYDATCEITKETTNQDVATARHLGHFSDVREYFDDGILTLSCKSVSLLFPLFLCLFFGLLLLFSLGEEPASFRFSDEQENAGSTDC